MNETMQAARGIDDDMLAQVMNDNRHDYAEAVASGWAVDVQRLQWHYEIQQAEALRRRAETR